MRYFNLTMKGLIGISKRVLSLLSTLKPKGVEERKFCFVGLVF